MGQYSELADDMRPPVNVWAQTLDATSRSYDLSVLTAQGRAYDSSQANELVYLTVQADGAKCYLAFDSVSTRTIAEGTAVAAGGTPAYAAAHCFVVPDGQERSFVVNRVAHRYIVLKGSGAGYARIAFSSKATTVR